MMGIPAWPRHSRQEPAMPTTPPNVPAPPPPQMKRDTQVYRIPSSAHGDIVVVEMPVPITAGECAALEYLAAQIRSTITEAPHVR